MATASAIVSRQLGTKFAHAAPELLTWAQERQFFQLQVRNVTDANASLQAAVANNVERTIESIRDAAVACAAMGLSMNPIAQLVYFIPRRERKFNEDLDKSEADYKAKVPWIVYPSPSYRGLAYICTRYAGADDVAAEVVFEADKFHPRGPFAIPEHHPTTDNNLRTFKHAIGVYVGFRWPGGRERSEYLDANMIARIRSMSDRPNAVMWHPDKLWTEGWKKAAVRRGSKLAIQGNPRLDAAETTMREHEGATIEGEAREVPRGTEPGPEGPQAPPRAKPRGMHGLKTGLETSQIKQNVAQEAEAAADAAVATKPDTAAVVSPEKPAEQTQPTERELKRELEGGSKPSDWWIDPASKNPPGSIEWWGDQLRATKTRSDLHVVQREAIHAGVDKSADAEAFTSMYREASQRLRRQEPQPRGLL